MQLIGQAIRHETFGKGIVTRLGPEYPHRLFSRRRQEVPLS